MATATKKATEIQRTAFAKKIVAYLVKLTTCEGLDEGPMFGTPTIHQEEHGPEIAWDGPFEWALNFGSEGMLAAELGRFSDPEAGAVKLCDEAQAAGMMLEPASAYRLAIGWD